MVAGRHLVTLGGAAGRGSDRPLAPQRIRGDQRPHARRADGQPGGEHDQPEDDLDNRFIADCIVPTMRDEKKKRQFIFSTHNANIPVLGDAEQIVGLTPVVEAGVEHATIPDSLCGSIDTPAIKEMIKDLLEGGQEAFEFRKEKYGF